MTSAKKGTAKKATKKSAAKRSATTTAKKSSAKKATKKSSGEGQACWPGFKRVPGTTAGAKGSCEPKAKQTAAEKKADGKAAAASKREKAGSRK
jgi:ribonuclease E